MNIFSIIFMTSQTNNNNKDTAQRGSERRVGVGGGGCNPLNPSSGSTSALRFGRGHVYSLYKPLRCVTLEWRRPG